MTLVDSLPPTLIDRNLVNALASRLGDLLADERLDRRARNQRDPTNEEEHDFARTAVHAELLRLSAVRRSEGKSVLTVFDEAAVSSAAIAQVLGLGRLQLLLEDDEISDVHVRGNCRVWVKLRNGQRETRDPIVDTDEELIELVRRAATRLSRQERRFDAGTPELNMQLPDGSRLFATMTVSLRPSLVIRRHRFEISSLEELRLRGLLTEELQNFLTVAVRARRNFVIAGGTGSGKTTLLRALINEVPPSERIVTIEDAYELGLDHFEHLHPDHDALQSRPANIEGQGEITLADLTRMALRMDPDRVIVGEVRGAEAFPMLLAMSQGNNGSMCTMHADSTRSVFPKLAAYVSMASTGLPIDTVNLLLASALHFVIYIDNSNDWRQVASVREVVDCDGSNIISNEIFSLDKDGELVKAFPLRESTRELLAKYGYEDRSES
ncbi:MAG: CpaF family protein [Actinobacteria bacterium]|nr:CpaF family protein [Actinomycetota bacterium]NDF88543.1 CpaF family protein [Actinomycetota bacterium]